MATIHNQIYASYKLRPFVFVHFWKSCVKIFSNCSQGLWLNFPNFISLLDMPKDYDIGYMIHQRPLVVFLQLWSPKMTEICLSWKHIFVETSAYLQELSSHLTTEVSRSKGPVKLVQRVKIAHSFSEFVSNLFHFINLSLPCQKKGEISRFNLESHSWPTLKISCSLLRNSYPKL